MCLDVLWGLLCWLQLFPQCCHKYPQGSHIVIPTAAPDILCDKGMGQYLADILGQQTQQLILNGCQVKFVFIQISASPGIIHFQLTIHKYRTGSKHLCRHQRESSLRHPKSCQQFFYRKGLCQIIVRSGIQRLDFIVILASSADYNYRNIGSGAYRLNDLNAIHIRQAQIQQDDFRIVRCGLHNGCRAIGRYRITIIICFQCGCNEISYRRVILNH